MSDGSLSQDEIDALLNGGDSIASGGAPSGSNASNNGALQSCLSETTASQASSLSTQLGASVKVQGPDVSSVNRDQFLSELPDQVVAIKADFSAGIPGEHVFIMGEDTAKKAAAMMNQEESIELDDMAMSVLGELGNQISGTEITTLSGKTGIGNIAATTPQATHVPKAVVALPAGTFYLATYSLNLGDGQSHTLWEVLGQAVGDAIIKALTVPAASPSAAGNPAGAGGSPGAGAAFGGSPGGAMPGMGMPGGLGGGMNMGGGMGMGGGQYFGQPTNVQPVQYPNLAPTLTGQEANNINLLMDVNMEVTVELGRTKKLIKDILGFGEGTIIELDKLAGEPVDILVNHKLIAKGEVVVIDENFGVRITDIVSPMERVSDLG